MHNHTKRLLLITIIFCVVLLTPAFWFPSWHMYIVVACILCLAALPAIFLTITILFVLVWALTRFMVKGEN